MTYIHSFSHFQAEYFRPKSARSIPFGCPWYVDFIYFSHFQTEYFRPITNISGFRRSSRTRHFYINRSYLSKVYSTISPDDDKPLVLVLEECDKLITNVIQGNVKPHLYIPIPMMDKSDWNSMLDKVTDLGFYPNLILILTSNISRDALHELDASILRDGRIDKAYHMTDNRE
jgi:hypothetical protein